MMVQVAVRVSIFSIIVLVVLVVKIGGGASAGHCDNGQGRSVGIICHYFRK